MLTATEISKLDFVLSSRRVRIGLLPGLKTDGVLAVQMPHNFSAPSHTLIAETVRNFP